MPHQSPQPEHDDRIRQSPVARWENEGGATATGHTPSSMKQFCSRIIAYTKHLIRRQPS